MTPETQQALIAESNRLIASRSARRHRARDVEDETDGDDASSEDSAFARLVADLQSVSAVSRHQ